MIILLLIDLISQMILQIQVEINKKRGLCEKSFIGFSGFFVT